MGMIKLAEIKSMMTNEELEELEKRVQVAKDKSDWKVEGSAFFNKLFEDIKEVFKGIGKKNKEPKTPSGNAFWAKFEGLFKRNNNNKNPEAEKKINEEIVYEEITEAVEK